MPTEITGLCYPNATLSQFATASLEEPFLSRCRRLVDPLHQRVRRAIGAEGAHHLRFKRDAVMPEHKLRELIGTHGFTIANLSQRLISEGKIFEYRMVICSRDRANAQELSQHLLSLSEVIEFRISPTGD